MTRKLTLALILVFGLAVGTSAHAAAGGLFVGAAVGYGSQDLDISTENFEENSTAWKVFVGSKPAKFFGVEAGYVDFGSASADLDLGAGNVEVTSDLTGWNVELVGTIPLGKYFEIYGKGGYLWWNSDVSSPSLSQSTSGSDWIYGAGAAVIFGEKIALRLEYEKYDIEDTNSVYLISAGFEWRF